MVEAVADLSEYSASSPVLEKVRCLYAFGGNGKEELPFEENEELEILDKPEEDPEWWVARSKAGTIGLVPRIYTEVIENNFPGKTFYFTFYSVTNYIPSASKGGVCKVPTNFFFRRKLRHICQKCLYLITVP